MPKIGKETKKIDIKKLRFSRRTERREVRSISSFTVRILGSLSFMSDLYTIFGILNKQF
jgi:hypothetical protein